MTQITLKGVVVYLCILAHGLGGLTPLNYGHSDLCWINELKVLFYSL